jgi:hypothetical protein
MKRVGLQSLDRTSRRAFVGLLLLAVLMRVALPVSPLLTAEGSSASGLVICTAHGIKIITDPSLEPEQPNSDHVDHHDCSTLCSPVAVAGVADAGPLAPIYSAAVHWPRFDFTTPPARAGPQVSIRGPPITV